jgi:hypothetical protein
VRSFIEIRPGGGRSVAALGSRDRGNPPENPGNRHRHEKPPHAPVIGSETARFNPSSEGVRADISFTL